MADHKYYSHFLKKRLMEYFNDVQDQNTSSVNSPTSVINITQQQELAFENAAEEIASRGEQFIPIPKPEESDMKMEAIEDNLGETVSFVTDNPEEITSHDAEQSDVAASCSHLIISEQGFGVPVKTENNNDSEESDDINSEETNNNESKEENPELNMLYSSLLKEPYEVFSPKQLKDIISKSFNMANIINDTERNRCSLELPSGNLSEDKLKVKNKVVMKTLEVWRISRNNGIKKFSKLLAEEKEVRAKIEKVKALFVTKNIAFDEQKFKMLNYRQIKVEAIVEPKNLSTRSPTQSRERQEQLENLNKIFPTPTSTPIKATTYNFNITDNLKTTEDGMVIIGPNGTMVAKTALQAINWSLSGAAVTRKILKEVFGRDTLAFHTLTGKVSPAFVDCNKPKKNQLDPLKVADVTNFVLEHTTLTMKEVRNVITIKCADENKMFRQREQKRRSAALKLQQQTED